MSLMSWHSAFLMKYICMYLYIFLIFKPANESLFAEQTNSMRVGLLGKQTLILISDKYNLFLLTTKPVI